ncbi:zinc finger protein 699-like isoform X2 [Phlebotomus argentipes]|uniref:zinc finger protein 699-like isoform X2 n=1 Tax=Phlebotomus argentipes TaxID=94469 RepID=UPI0028936A57|nr:zinc finger protein 699-like isoform X2 [Phlebotomus argentipes]
MDRSINRNIKEEFEIQEIYEENPMESPSGSEVPSYSKNNEEFVSFEITQFTPQRSRRGQNRRNNLQCVYCSKIYYDKYQLATHIKTHIEKPVRCFICKRVYKHTASLRLHLQKQHYIFKTPKELKAEMKQMQREDKDEKVKTVVKIENHEKLEVMICKVCEHTFTSKYRYERHLGTHKIFQCETCMRKFTKKQALLDHVSIHKNEKPFCCNRCDKTFRLETHMKIHMKKIHMPSTGEPEHCPYCARRYNQLSRLQTHLKNCHRGLPRIPRSVPKCTVCSEIFKNMRELIAHVAVHRDERLEKIFECAICDLKFRVKHTLARHIEKIHLRLSNEWKKKQYYKCPDCEKSYTSKHYMEIHRRIHSSQSDDQVDQYINCEICSKPFKTMFKLKIHMKNHEIIDKLGKMCPYCLKVFDKNKTSLINHLRAGHRGLPFNTKDPPFRCGVCKDVQKTLDDLKKHVIMHADDFKCEECGRNFHSTSTLRKHFNKFH